MDNDLIGFHHAAQNTGKHPSFLLRPVRMGCEYCGRNFQISRDGDYPYVTLHILFSGCSFFRIDSGEYLLKKGDAFLVLSGEEHFYSNLQNSSLGYLWIELDVKGCPELLQWLRLKNVHTLDAARTGELTQQLLQILRYFKDNGAPDIFAASAMCYTLVMLLFSAESSVPARQIPAPVTAALYYISRHFSETPSVEQIAAYSNVSESCLSKHFRRYVGASPAQYVLLKKAEYAVFLLKNTALTCDQIAEQCGFFDAAHLNKVFSRHVGCSPSQIRISGADF